VLSSRGRSRVQLRYLGTEWVPAADILWTRGRCGGHLFVLTLITM
jgi:hypothetical protein